MKSLLLSAISFLAITNYSLSQLKFNFTSRLFTYTLLADSSTTDDSASFNYTIISIIVKDKNGGKQVQVIEPEENFFYTSIPPEQFFIIEDMNFDGYSDFRLLQFLPAAPNIPYYYWLYDPKTKQFQRDTALEEITSPSFDAKKKEISSFWRASCCDHGFSIYKYVNGKPVLMSESETVVETKGNVDEYTSVEKKRINGKMKVVSRKVEKEKVKPESP